MNGMVGGALLVEGLLLSSPLHPAFALALLRNISTRCNIILFVLIPANIRRISGTERL